MNMRERFEDAYPPRLNGGFCKERNWYERKDDGRWYPDIERNHQWNIWQKAWQACEACEACEASQTQQNAELRAASIGVLEYLPLYRSHVENYRRAIVRLNKAIAKAGVK